MPILFLYSGLPAFGYAKPVPVNPSRLRDPRRQSLYVSLAGPAVNILLSGVGYVMCEIALHSIHSQGLLQLGFSFGIVNLILAAFNLLPIPPLDGSAVIERFLPTHKLPAYYRFRQYAFPLVFAFILITSVFTHVRATAVNDLENWWIGLLF